MSLTIQHNEYARIKWSCRRGMLELDLILIPFFEQNFVNLPSVQKQAFINLLEQPDPDIFNWLMGYTQPDEPELGEIITVIRHAKH